MERSCSKHIGRQRRACLAQELKAHKQQQNCYAIQAKKDEVGKSKQEGQTLRKTPPELLVFGLLQARTLLRRHWEISG